MLHFKTCSMAKRPWWHRKTLFKILYSYTLLGILWYLTFSAKGPVDHVISWQLTLGMTRYESKSHSQNKPKDLKKVQSFGQPLPWRSRTLEDSERWWFALQVFFRIGLLRHRSPGKTQVSTLASWPTQWPDMTWRTYFCIYGFLTARSNKAKKRKNWIDGISRD